MLRKAIIAMLRYTLPPRVRAFLFPHATWTGVFKRRFVSIDDDLADRPIRMYLREDSMMERQFLDFGLYGRWEKESLRIWATLAREASTILDVGANTGVFSLVAQNNNPNAKVVAVEPVGVNFEVLTLNCEENKFPVHRLNVALSDREGTATMHMLKDKLNYMTSVKGNLYADFPDIQGDSEVVQISVPTKPFSWVLETCNLKTVDLVKIDVEGHELSVLQSMMSAVKQFRPSILLEVIGDDTAAGVESMLQGLGYVFISIDEVNKSKVVNKLWDNDRHNFLFCQPMALELLREKKLVD